MNTRLELHEKLVEILGSRNVYFQPPETLKMQYPCIVYNRSDIDIKYADDGVYLRDIAYQVIYIDKDPDGEVIDKLVHFKYSKYQRHYVMNNLNYDSFIIKY